MRGRVIVRFGGCSGVLGGLAGVLYTPHEWLQLSNFLFVPI